MPPDFFEKNLRRELLSPWSKWPLILGGIGFFFAAGIVEMRTGDLSHAAALYAIGSGTMLYGITEMRLRQSRWYWVLALTSVVLWFGGAFWAVYRFI
jgi:hypothetical protein